MVWRAERFITLIVAFFNFWCVIAETVERCTRDLLATVVCYVNFTLEKAQRDGKKNHSRMVDSCSRRLTWRMLTIVWTSKLFQRLSLFRRQINFQRLSNSRNLIKIQAQYIYSLCLCVCVCVFCFSFWLYALLLCLQHVPCTNVLKSEKKCKNKHKTRERKQKTRDAF